MRHIHFAAAAAFLIAPAAAQAQVVTATPDAVEAAMRSADFPVTRQTASDGDPQIISSFNGHRFVVNFYGCTDHRDCDSLNLYFGISVDGNFPTEKVNAWNNELRFVRAYVDDVGDPCLEMDVDLDKGGMSRALFVDELRVWGSALLRFRSAVDGE